MFILAIGRNPVLATNKNCNTSFSISTKSLDYVIGTFRIPAKQIKYRCQEHDTINNYYKGIAHIDYVKKDTPPYYGLHETGSSSISYNDFFLKK